MTIFELLQREQRELDALFDELQLCTDQEAWSLFHIASSRWTACMRAKHAIVYPQLAVRGLQQEVLEAVRDHRDIERGIAHVRLAPMCPIEWREAVRELRTRIADRSVWEQWELCPLAALSFSRAELVRLTRAYVAFQPVAMSAASASITYEPAPVPRAEPRTVRVPAVA